MIIFDGAIRIWAVIGEKKELTQRAQRAQREEHRGHREHAKRPRYSAGLLHSKRAISEDGPYNSKRRSPHRIGQFVGRGSALACSASCLETRLWAAIRSRTWSRRVLAASGYFRGEYRPGDQIMHTSRA